MKALFIYIFLFIFYNFALVAQTTLNPDISIIPRFSISTNDAEESNAHSDDGHNDFKFSTPVGRLDEIELALQGYLNPYARGDIFLSWHGLEGKVEIEEAYASFVRGLPLDLNIRAGKYLVEFGKLNTLHPHAWSFVNQPFVLKNFLGEEGLNMLGLSASSLLPTGDLYSRITFDVLRKLTADVHTDELDSHAHETASMVLEDTLTDPRYFFSSRLMTFFPVTEYSDLELGISGLTGIHDRYYDERFYYGNLDFKYKWKPSMYQSLTLQGEWLINFRKAFRDGDTTYFIENGKRVSKQFLSTGFYFFGDYQFAKRYTVGARVDYAQFPYSNDDYEYGASVFFGFYPVEETTVFRLQFSHTKLNLGNESKNINSITLQFIFSLGPHRAHTF